MLVEAPVRTIPDAPPSEPIQDDVEEVLFEAIRYIEKGWTRGELARNKLGAKVPPNHSDATSWCMLGAIQAAAGGRIPITGYANGLVQRAVVGPVSNFNDMKLRRKSQVIRAFQKAILDRKAMVARYGVKGANKRLLTNYTL